MLATDEKGIILGSFSFIPNMTIRWISTRDLYKIHVRAEWVKPFGDVCQKGKFLSSNTQKTQNPAQTLEEVYSFPSVLSFLFLMIDSWTKSTTEESIAEYFGGVLRRLLIPQNHQNEEGQVAAFWQNMLLCLTPQCYFRDSIFANASCVGSIFSPTPPLTN